MRVLRVERRATAKMKLSMSSVDFRIVFVSGGEVTRAEDLVWTSSGILGIFILDILKNHKISKFGDFSKMNKMKILKIPELIHTSARVTSPPDTKRPRESTGLIESFIFCRRSPLNSQNSQQESSVELGKFQKKHQIS